MSTCGACAGLTSVIRTRAEGLHSVLFIAHVHVHVMWSYAEMISADNVAFLCELMDEIGRKDLTDEIKSYIERTEGESGMCECEIEFCHQNIGPGKNGPSFFTVNLGPPGPFSQKYWSSLNILVPLYYFAPKYA